MLGNNDSALRKDSKRTSHHLIKIMRISVVIFRFSTDFLSQDLNLALNFALEQKVDEYIVILGV